MSEKQFIVKEDSGVSIVTPASDANIEKPEFANTTDRSQGRMMTYQDGNAVEHGADIINTHKEGHMVAHNKFHHPISMKEALADPETTTIQIGKLQVQTNVAIRQGLISDAGEFNQAEVETQKPAQTQQQSFISKEGENFIQQATQHMSKPVLDAAVAKIFVSTGMEGKQDAAIDHFANELGVEPVVGEKIANTLIKDICETTENHLAGAFGEDAASAIMNKFMTFDPIVRSNLLLRLYHGDRSAISELLSRI